PLPRLAEVAQGERGWTGRAAETVAAAVATTITTLPSELRRSLTWDQGSEMYQHAKLKIDANLDVYFCDPHRPLAARHQQEHQRPAASILPQRHRPLGAHA